jgi:hypothetical protein
VLDRALDALTPPANTIAHVKLVAAHGVFHEWWQLTSRPFAGRWTGTLGGGPEVANDGKKEYVYDEGANAIYTRGGASPPGLSSPLAQIRADLAGGRARALGSRTVGGATVNVVALPHGFVAYLDPKTSRPSFVDYPTRGGLVRLRVVALEYLPRTPDALRLLSLTAQHPDARVAANAAAWGGKGRTP